MNLNLMGKKSSSSLAAVAKMKLQKKERNIWVGSIICLFFIVPLKYSNILLLLRTCFCCGAAHKVKAKYRSGNRISIDLSIWNGRTVITKAINLHTPFLAIYYLIVLSGERIINKTDKKHTQNNIVHRSGSFVEANNYNIYVKYRCSLFCLRCER